MKARVVAMCILVSVSAVAQEKQESSGSSSGGGESLQAVPGTGVSEDSTGGDPGGGSGLGGGGYRVDVGGFPGGGGYEAFAPMKPVAFETAAVAKALGHSLVLVVDDQNWDYRQIPEFFDELAKQQLAAAIIKSLQGTELEGPLIQSRGGEVHLRYSQDSFEQSGRYIPNVLATLKESASKRAEERADRKVAALLGGNLSQSAAAEADAAELQHRYADAERKAAAVARQIRESASSHGPVPGGPGDTDGIAELRGRLQELVTAAFELRMQLQEAQLASAEARLNATRERLAQRRQLADRIIQDRVRELETGEDTSWLAPQ